MTYDPTPRDPRGTDPRNKAWSLYAGIGLTIVVLLALAVLWTPMPESTHTVSNTPPPTSTPQ
jgi:hypothetical protein